MLADPENSNEGNNCGNEAEVIVEMFLKEPVLPHSKHTQYWKQKKPCLAYLACKYLAILPSSVALERLFSSAADVISPERNRILPEKAEMLLFIKKNLLVVGPLEY